MQFLTVFKIGFSKNMSNKSIVYQNSFSYRLGFRLFHKCDISKRNGYIASLIKKKETVLEPGCGLGSLAHYLSPGIRYLGFDKNDSFLKYGLKRGLDLYAGDFLNKTSYQNAEVVITCDTSHHLNREDRKKFIKYCYSFAKRLFIFCDCTREEGLLRKILYPLNQRIFEYLEKDGFNEPKYKDFHKRKELREEIENGFGIINGSVKREIKDFGCDLLAVFYK